MAIDLRESRETVVEFFTDKNLSFKALLDPDGAVGRSFGIRSIPTTFIIDSADGMIGKAMGPRKWESQVATQLFEILTKLAKPEKSP